MTCNKSFQTAFRHFYFSVSKSFWRHLPYVMSKNTASFFGNWLLWALTLWEALIFYHTQVTVIGYIPLPPFPCLFCRFCWSALCELTPPRPLSGGGVYTGALVLRAEGPTDVASVGAVLPLPHPPGQLIAPQQFWRAWCGTAHCQVRLCMYNGTHTLSWSGSLSLVMAPSAGILWKLL